MVQPRNTTEPSNSKFRTIINTSFNKNFLYILLCVWFCMIRHYMKIAQEQLFFPAKVHIISYFLSVIDEHLSIFKPQNDSYILISYYYLTESSPVTLPESDLLILLHFTINFIIHIKIFRIRKLIKDKSIQIGEHYRVQRWWWGLWFGRMPPAFGWRISLDTRKWY